MSLPRELANALTRAMQPDLVSPGGSDQPRRCRTTSHSSYFVESPHNAPTALDMRMVSLSRIPGDDLDHPLWNGVPSKRSLCLGVIVL
jgi:hypothetical protein